MPPSLINLQIDPALQNLSNPSWDTFLILFFIGAAILYSFFVSRERLAVALISVYSSLAIVTTTPNVVSFLASAPKDIAYQYRLGLFLALFVVLFILFSHAMHMRTEIGHHWWQAIILSILQVGLLMSTVLALIGTDRFSSNVSQYFFTSDTARSAWLLAPVFAMLLLRRRDHHSGGNHFSQPR